MMGKKYVVNKYKERSRKLTKLYINLDFDDKIKIWEREERKLRFVKMENGSIFNKNI